LFTGSEWSEGIRSADVEAPGELNVPISIVEQVCRRGDGVLGTAQTHLFEHGIRPHIMVAIGSLPERGTGVEPMDVLQYWRPTISWSGFRQGVLPDAIWSAFKDLVQLCHAHRHWQAEARKIRYQGPPRSYSPQETKNMLTKRRRQWEGEISKAEGHMYRAAYLAAEKISAISYLLTAADEGTPGSKLYVSLAIAVGHQPNHDRARCGVAAFDSFDADSELAGDPAEIVQRWLGDDERIRARD